MFGTKEPTLCPLAPEFRAWTDAVMSEVEPARLRAEVEGMPAPRNRLHSPDAMARADEMILRGFRDAGWSAQAHAFEFSNARGYLDYPKDGFPAGVVMTNYEHLKGANLVALKEGEASRAAFVVGAHHDTLRDSPGADDNTASVVALLELARRLAPYRFRETVMLATFDMEEINMFGSRSFVERFSREREIRGAVVFESMSYTSTAPNSQYLPQGIGLLYTGQVGRIKRRQFAGDWTLVIYRRSAAELARHFAEALAYILGPEAGILVRDPGDLPLVGRYMRRLVPAVKNFARSDHVSFWNAGLPAIMISDTANYRNPNYHKPTDTPGTLDYERLAAIIGATAAAVARSAGLIGRVPAHAL